MFSKKRAYERGRSVKLRKPVWKIQLQRLENPTLDPNGSPLATAADLLFQTHVSTIAREDRLKIADNVKIRQIWDEFGESGGRGWG